MSGQVRPDLSVLSGFSEVAKGDKPPFWGWILAQPPAEPSPFPPRCPSQIGTGAGFSTEGGAGLVLYGFVYFQLISLMDRLQPVYTLYSTVGIACLNWRTEQEFSNEKKSKLQFWQQQLSKAVEESFEISRKCMGWM